MMKNQWIAILGIFIFTALGFVSWILYPLPAQLDQVLLGPTTSHWLGTDSLGRDVLWRTLQGYAFSVSLALLASVLSGTLGVAFGLLSGWKGGRMDIFLMRLCEIFEAIPDLIMAICWMLALETIFSVETVAGRFFALVAALALTGWSDVARQARALGLRERGLPYIEAAQATGASPGRIFVVHMWPNIRTSILFLMVLQIPAFILFESSLSFFGFGLRSPEPSLGQLFVEGWKVISVARHLIWPPTVLLFLTLLALRRWQKASV